MTLLAVVLPAVTDPSARVAIEMMDNVLRNVVARSRAEIAWMLQEIAAIDALADACIRRFPHDDALATARQLLAEASSTDLVLDSVCERYSRASGVLTACISVAQRAGDSSDIDRCFELLRDRNRREHELMCDWAPTGRG